ncbi:MAG: NosD domain-containing protein, partial [Pseudomonadales bacterium]
MRTNVLSGNGDDGIEISGDARGVTVNKAIIGLNTNGLVLLPNGDNGVEIGGNAHHNVIGGFDPSVIPQNTISGNMNHGVAIIGDARDNQVFNNFIGTDLLGLQMDVGFGNGGAGVFLGDNTQHNTIGGKGAEDRNLISGNVGHGVELTGATHHNKIIANLIGSDRLGIALPGFGNQGAGVFLDNGTHHNTITANTASGNGSAGFFLQGSNHNRLTGNSAVENTGDGFRLEDSNFNTLKSNTAKNNDGDGFHVENSNDNKFIKNSAEENDGLGFFVDELFANMFKKNQCALNVLGGSNLLGICLAILGGWRSSYLLDTVG